MTMRTDGCQCGAVCNERTNEPWCRMPQSVRLGDIPQTARDDHTSRGAAVSRRAELGFQYFKKCGDEIARNRALRIEIRIIDGERHSLHLTGREGCAKDAAQLREGQAVLH